MAVWLAQHKKINFTYVLFDVLVYKKFHTQYSTIVYAIGCVDSNYCDMYYRKGQDASVSSGNVCRYI